MAGKADMTIMLRTEGAPTIKSDLKSIADAGDQAADRLAKAFEREAVAADRAAAKSAAAWGKADAAWQEAFGKSQTAAAGPAPSTAAPTPDDRLTERRAQVLRDMLDPAGKAQRTFNADVATAKELLDRGAISAEEYAGAVRLADEALTRAQKSLSASSAGYSGLEAEQRRVAAAAQRIMEAVDPAAAAERRFAAAADEAFDAFSNNAISLETYQKRLGQLGKELEQSGNAAVAAAAKNRNLRFGLQDLSFQISDVATSFAGGISPMMIFAQQGGQVAFSFTQMAQGGGKFAQFLEGPWLSLGVASITILTALATNLDLFNNKLGEEEEKLRKAAEAQDLSKEAARRFDATLPGLIDKERKLNDELEKEIRNQRELAQLRAGTAAQTTLGLKAEADAALRELRAAEKNAEDGKKRGLTGIASTRGADQRRLEAASKKYDDAMTAWLDAQTDQRKAEALVLQDRARAMADPKLAERNRIEDQQAALTNRYSLGLIGDDQYKAQFAKLQGQLDAVGKSASAASGDNALGGMVALLKSLGFVVAHTTDGKHVKGSEHYSGHAIDFVPRGGMGSMTKAEVEQILTDAGVQFSYGKSGVKQFFGPGDKGHSDHFHVGFKGSPTPDSADKAYEAAAARALRDSQALDAAYSRAAGDRAAILRKGNHSIEEQAELDRQAVDARLAEKLLQNAKLNLAHRALDAYDVYTAQLEKQAITAAAQEELNKPRTEAVKYLEGENQRLGLNRELLELQLRYASVKDQADVVAIARLQLQLDLGEKFKSLKADEIDALIAEQMAQRKLTDEVERTRAGYEELRDQGANALESLLDPNNFDNWGDNAKSVLRSVLLEIEKLAIINPLLNSIFGGNRATIGGSGGLLGAIFGGKSGPSKSFTAAFASFLPGHAAGTDSAPGGWSLVGERGPELVNLTPGARVLTASQTRGALAAGGGDSFHTRISIDARGAGPREVDRLEAQIQQLRRDMPAIAVTAYRDARDRRAA